MRYNNDANTFDEVHRYYSIRALHVAMAVPTCTWTGILYRKNIPTPTHPDRHIYYTYFHQREYMYINSDIRQKYLSVYVPHDYRGTGAYLDGIGDLEITPILTLDTCNISEFLHSHDLPSRIVGDGTDNNMYRAISEYYQDRTANRSGVELMNHIDEGLLIIRLLSYYPPFNSQPGYHLYAKRAFALHPIYQSDDINLKTTTTNALVKSKEAEPPGSYFGDIDARKIIKQAIDYASVANSYLCRPETDHYTVDDVRLLLKAASVEVRWMLIADKVQNQRDFNLYHLGTHPRSKELSNYFKTWIKALDVPPDLIDMYYSILKFRDVKKECIIV